MNYSVVISTNYIKNHYLDKYDFKDTVHDLSNMILKIQFLRYGP